MSALTNKNFQVDTKSDCTHYCHLELLLSDRYTEFKIACGHRPFSVRLIRTAGHCDTCSVQTADRPLLLLLEIESMKRRSTQGDSGSTNAKKCVTYDTFAKWQRELDRECQTLSWLDCQTGMEGGKKIVEKLKCKVCTKFVDKIRGRKNFSDKWICGADSVRTSNVRDHAHNDMHIHAV